MFPNPRVRNVILTKNLGQNRCVLPYSFDVQFCKFLDLTFKIDDEKMKLC